MARIGEAELERLKASVSVADLVCQSALNSFQGRASKTFHFVRSVSAVFCAA